MSSLSKGTLGGSTRCDGAKGCERVQIWSVSVLEPYDNLLQYKIWQRYKNKQFNEFKIAPFRQS